MGAATFLDFMQSFILETLLNIALRIYIDPGIDAALEKYEWALRVYKRYRAQQEILRDEEGADDDLDMALWEDEEDEETKSPVEDIISSYASYSAESIGTLFAPLTILFVQWTEPNIGMGAAYGIKRTQFVYFWVFGFVMIPFLLVKDLFLHNVTELHHGWKVYDYMKYCKHRYSKRMFRWKAYYFVLSLATIGIGLLIMSLEALIRQTDRITSASPYNPFQDKMLPFVIVIMFALCKWLHWLSIYLGHRILWRHKPVKADVDEAGILLDGEKNELNLPDWGGQPFGTGGGGMGGIDITSDSFRHRFFEANKPWIIQQLRQTMSPRAQLEALMKGEAQPEDTFGVRQDISDDEGTESDSDLEDKIELDAAAKHELTKG
ncbi:hypothetical protein GUITHDRAFT_141646 [Guillardia theta CCMP2712]|uniref:Uncharacterized protein n=1 Tax=Guillardia theta (strain CCMP2712) TaxID=905079 RepID=L1J0S6_GUITC|nr:hypothetical protein GUITHDRAFT_141646 [Guillardia theta CCMP2712]EKX41902.1 hypothetical protein GUITHDRAFT_141646 [Guillardia theta CCMP2712]|eukprot:XP_005828882.1 hypothetical protein GUITHDRAFT_141646 [Guillardia theta CCMP2712]